MKLPNKVYPIGFLNYLKTVFFSKTYLITQVTLSEKGGSKIKLEIKEPILSISNDCIIVSDVENGKRKPFIVLKYMLKKTPEILSKMGQLDFIDSFGENGIIIERDVSNIHIFTISIMINGKQCILTN